MLSNERQQQVVALCQKLIQQQSYSGHEDGVVKALSEYLTAEGFDSITVDKYGNIIVELEDDEKEIFNDISRGDIKLAITRLLEERAERKIWADVGCYNLPEDDEGEEW
jgi:hypothetical protein